MSEPTNPFSTSTSHSTSYEPPRYPVPAVGRPETGRSAASLGSRDEVNWAVGAHLSGFVAAWVALGFLGPLVVLLAAGNRSAFVRRHAVEALNFNLSVLIYVAAAAILSIILIGIPLLVGIGLLYLVSSIMGAAAASRGEEFRYPLTIRFVH